jgi:hypothetical protein
LLLPIRRSLLAKGLRSGFRAAPAWTKYAGIVPLFLKDERARIIVRALTNDPGSLTSFAEQK